jgi:hypothetical protein
MLQGKVVGRLENPQQPISRAIETESAILVSAGWHLKQDVERIIEVNFPRNQAGSARMKGLGRG